MGGSRGPAPGRDLKVEPRPDLSCAASSLPGGAQGQRRWLRGLTCVPRVSPAPWALASVPSSPLPKFSACSTPRAALESCCPLACLFPLSPLPGVPSLSPPHSDPPSQPQPRARPRPSGPGHLKRDIRRPGRAVRGHRRPPASTPSSPNCPCCTPKPPRCHPELPPGHPGVPSLHPNTPGTLPRAPACTPKTPNSSPYGQQVPVGTLRSPPCTLLVP